jgi:predicted RNase H-like HicB family nuclease
LESAGYHRQAQREDVMKKLKSSAQKLIAPAEANARRFDVHYEQDPEKRWWTATVPEVPGVVSQGKTLKEAHHNVRQAISLVLEQEEEPFVTSGETHWGEHAELAEDELELVKVAGDLRIQALETQGQLERVTQAAVRTLYQGRGFSYREIGRLLGITHQRVEQLVRVESED